MTFIFLAAEVCFAGIAVLAAYTFPDFAQRYFSSLRHVVDPLVKRPRLAVITIGLLALAGRAAVLPVLPVPQPTIHDEFSYLLAADTFAHGRLANPAHPMWKHFESFHINQKPTYASMYYPAQGLLLALGQVVFGHPFFAVWLSVGLMCASICWMLQGWLPAKWALLGGFLAVMRLGVFSYWANSYYGGALPAIGGALVLGALPRIKRRQRVRDAVLMALGLAIIANTRAFEGLFFGIPVAVALFAWMFGRKRPSFAVSLRNVVLPIGLLLGLTIAGMGYYFWRVTGNPFKIPYQVNIEMYGLVYFPWQQLQPPPEYRHAVLRDFYQGRYNVGHYQDARWSPIVKASVSVVFIWVFFLGPLLSLPLISWAAVKGENRYGRFVSRKSRFFLWVCLISSLGLLLPIYVPQPHYAAPLTAVIYFILLQSMRHVRFWRWNGTPTGLMIVLAIPAVCFALLLLRLPVLHDPVLLNSPQLGLIRTWASQQFTNETRAKFLAELTDMPGRHLVLVRYKNINTQPRDLMFNEFVYNEADIDNAKVVWAREMSPAENQELLRYFADRKAWLVEADQFPAKIVPVGVTGVADVKAPPQ